MGAVAALTGHAPSPHSVSTDNLRLFRHRKMMMA
jgi:hypothetical protein